MAATLLAGNEPPGLGPGSAKAGDGRPPESIVRSIMYRSSGNVSLRGAAWTFIRNSSKFWSQWLDVRHPGGHSGFPWAAVLSRARSGMIPFFAIRPLVVNAWVPTTRLELPPRDAFKDDDPDGLALYETCEQFWDWMQDIQVDPIRHLQVRDRDDH